MLIEYEYKYKAENGSWENAKGGTEINEEKFEMVMNKCKEWKCSLSDVVIFLIENLTEESADQLIGNMMF